MVLLCKASLDRKYFHISLHWKTAVTFPYFMFVKFIRGSEAEDVAGALRENHPVGQTRRGSGTAVFFYEFCLHCPCASAGKTDGRRHILSGSWRKPSAVNLTNDLLTP